jgi:uric acid transporter
LSTDQALAPASKRVHPVDEVLATPKLAAYGLQHVLAFYAGAVLVPILLASALHLSTGQLVHLINADLFTCGIASIIQSVGFWKVGVRLPLLQGVTFTAVSPMIAIGLAAGGGTNGLLAIYGSVIVAGLFTFLMAPYFAKLLRFFPPVVTGSVILIIGIALLPVAANDIVDGQSTLALQNPVLLSNIGYAMGTLLVIVAFQRIFRGFLGTIAVLAGLVIGTLVAWALSSAHFGDVGSAGWVGYTMPFYFGVPTFSVTAIVSMIVVMLITAVETTGDVYATGEIVGKRIKRQDIAAALRADGLATTIGGILNSFPYTCFAENVGLVRLTQVKSRWVVATAGVIMITLGSLPKAAAIVAGIPHPVLGGAALAMFAAVAVVGIQTLGKVDFNDHRAVIIVGTSVGLGMMVTAQPFIAGAFPDWNKIIFGSGITLGALAAILLNVIFNHIGGGAAVAGRPGDHLVTLDQVNEMTVEQFGETFGSLVEGSVWVIERAFAQRPFTDTVALRSAFHDALLSGTDAEQDKLLNSFTDLGTEDDGAYTGDHTAAGLGSLDEETYAEVGELAAAYRERFGFPLIVCARDVVARYERVLATGWSRLANAPSVERATALIEIAKIANYRFDDLVADANPIASARVARFGQLNR